MIRKLSSHKRSKFMFRYYNLQFLSFNLEIQPSFLLVAGVKKNVRADILLMKELVWLIKLE